MNCRAAVVGVHGSGKSTLLERFVPMIGDIIWRRDAEGNVITKNSNSTTSSTELRPTVWLQLRKSVPRSTAIPWAELIRGRLLILDGYEQLSHWRRASLIVKTRLRGIKLLLTSHRRTLLPTLCELSVAASTARHIVSQLTLGRDDLTTISDDRIQQCLQEHRGNMREVLMEFYDLVEEHRAVDMPKVKSKS